MGTTATKELMPEEVIREGWQALIDRLGYTNATGFLMSIERGEGDSVKEIREIRNRDSRELREVHEIIMKWKQGQKKG